MKMNFIKIGSRFRGNITHEIVEVKSYSVEYDAPFAVCNQFRDGKQIDDIRIDLGLLFNPKCYTELTEKEI